MFACKLFCLFGFSLCNDGVSYIEASRLTSTDRRSIRHDSFVFDSTCYVAVFGMTVLFLILHATSFILFRLSLSSTPTKGVSLLKWI